MADFMGARKMVVSLCNHFTKLFRQIRRPGVEPTADEFASLVRRHLNVSLQTINTTLLLEYFLMTLVSSVVGTALLP